MPELHTIALVAGAAAVLWLFPGPAWMLMLTRAVDLGPRGAVATALGLSLGTLLHVVAAAVGLSAILAASATAFTVVKALGGLYLIHLGVRRWRDPSPLLGTDEAAPARVTSDRRALVEGFTINALNPKLALFFLAFLPPFIDRGRGDVLLQTMVLGVVIAVVLLAGDTVFALATSRVGRAWLTRSMTPGRDRTARRVLGGIYISLGVLTLATGNGRSTA